MGRFVGLCIYYGWFFQALVQASTTHSWAQRSMYNGSHQLGCCFGPFVCPLISTDVWVAWAPGKSEVTGRYLLIPYLAVGPWYDLACPEKRAAVVWLYTVPEMWDLPVVSIVFWAHERIKGWLAERSVSQFLCNFIIGVYILSRASSLNNIPWSCRYFGPSNLREFRCITPRANRTLLFIKLSVILFKTTAESVVVGTEFDTDQA